MKNSFLSLFLAAAFVGCSSLPDIPGHGPDEIGFIDYYGNAQVVPIRQDVKKTACKAELFRRKKSMMLYDDSSYTVRQGVDISRHDGEVDWKKMKKSGFDFVILRAAYRGYQSGILHTDERFHENIRGAAAAGLDIGVYVFSQAVSEAEALEEAELVLSLIDGYDISLPVVFDPENIGWEEARTDTVSGEQFTQNTIAFCNRIRQAGYEPMVYANLTWQTMRLDLARISDCKMWYADYSDVPQTPYHFDYWQHHAQKKVPGVRKKCDVDILIAKTEPEERAEPDGATGTNAAEEAR